MFVFRNLDIIFENILICMKMDDIIIPLKFIYSEKATKIDKISKLFLTIRNNFSEYMNFTKLTLVSEFLNHVIFTKVIFVNYTLQFFAKKSIMNTKGISLLPRGSQRNLICWPQSSDLVLVFGNPFSYYSDFGQ